MEEQEVSEKFPEAPELYQDLEPIWECFLFLSPSRPQGSSVGAIPLSEIVTYWREIGGIKDRETLNEHVALIHALDVEYLAASREKANGIRNNAKNRG